MSYNIKIKIGQVVKWTGPQGWKVVKTGSLGIVVDYCPWRLVNFDVLFGCGTVMTCHMEDLEVIYEKI